jgi:hypothetical protein
MEVGLLEQVVENGVVSNNRNSVTALKASVRNQGVIRAALLLMAPGEDPLPASSCCWYF